MPVTTLQALCEQHAPRAIEFLKIDVEGAEREVLLGGDWQRFRPKVVVRGGAGAGHAGAGLGRPGSRCCTGTAIAMLCFDSLNRYYVAEEAREPRGAARRRRRARLTAVPPVPHSSSPRSPTPPSRTTGLARLLGGADMTRPAADVPARRWLDRLHHRP